jgi:ATP-binding cassette subfamily B multidrug efflux pump
MSIAIDSRGLPEGETQGKLYDLRLMKRLLSYLKPYAGLVLISLSVLLVGSMLQLVGPYLTKVAIDQYIVPGKITGLRRIASLYLLVLLVGFVFQYLRVNLLQLTGQRIIFHMRIQIFEHFMRLPLSFFERTPMGRLVTRAINDVEVINELFTQGIIVIFGDLVTLLGITCVLLWMDWRLSLVLFSLVPFLAIASIFYRTKARDAYRGVRQQLARMNAYLQENLSGMTTVQLFRRQEENFRRFEMMNQATRDQHIRSIFYSALFFPCVEMISAAALGLIIWYGGGRVIQEALLPGVLVAFIQYMRLFFQPLRDLAEKYNILQAAMAASERVFELMDTKVEIKIPPNPLKPAQRVGKIVFREVWFAHNPNEWVLRGVNFQIREGETVALVGATGAGKSSLVGLVGRTHDIQRGHIILDGIEIRQWSISELRRHVGVIPQDVFLFSGSVLENLRLWNSDISERKVREVAGFLQLDAFIMGLPQGYHTEIRPGGENLSLGQKQLLAFVRVLLYKPGILVLDEATSSVDPATETLIQHAMERLIQGRTCLIIAHRLSTIRKADRILVLHRGRILEEGSHEELISLHGMYHRIYALAASATSRRSSADVNGK